MKPAFSEQDLKAAISSSLRRQHLLGATPGAQRLLPLAAFAAGDFLANRSGTKVNIFEELLCEPESTSTAIQLPDIQTNRSEKSHVAPSTIVNSCLVCSRLPHGQIVPFTIRYISIPGSGKNTCDVATLGRAGSLWAHSSKFLKGKPVT